MTNNIIGRKDELKELESFFYQKKSVLGVLYGRRRIGKSNLLKVFGKDKERFLYFEALEKVPKLKQLNHAKNQLIAQTKATDLINKSFNNWESFLDELTLFCQSHKEKKFIVLDEFQWMASGQTSLVSLLQYYWDNQWKNQNVFIVLCGSIASFMVKKVINSKALYGRISYQKCLQSLPLNDSFKFFHRPNENDLHYLILFGGVPKYLEEINTQDSLDNNLLRLIYKADSFFVNEIDRIFYAQFKEPQNYRKIIFSLQNGSLSVDEISKKTKIKSGGGLKSYLEILELNGFIFKTNNFALKSNRNSKYKISDEYIKFYFKFIFPYLSDLKQNNGKNIYLKEVKKIWAPWLGLAFENLCYKNALFLAQQAGFYDQVQSIGVIQHKKVQIDIAFKKFDGTLVLTEVKLANKPISTEIVKEIQRKIFYLEELGFKKIETLLIAPNGVSRELKSSLIFNYILTQIDFY